MAIKHSHYKKDISHLSMLDPYRICQLFEVGGGPIEHAIKKLLVAGKRGAKDMAKDVQEAIDSLHRWQDMEREDWAKDEDGSNMVIISVPAKADHAIFPDVVEHLAGQRGKQNGR